MILGINRIDAAVMGAVLAAVFASRRCSTNGHVDGRKVFGQRKVSRR